MAKGNSGKAKAAANVATPAQPVVIGSVPSAINGVPMTQATVQAIIDEQEKTYGIDEILAIKQYIGATPQTNGYSMSQNMNWKLQKGDTMNANERYVDTMLTQAMHNLGADSKLYRADHADFLQDLGVSDYTKLSNPQLQQALIGKEWSTKSYTSTSYDKSKNPFISGAQSGGREVFLNINASKQAQTVFANKAQAEVILGKGTNFRITNVQYDGTMAYPRVGGAKPRIVIDVDVW